MEPVVILRSHPICTLQELTIAFDTPVGPYLKGFTEETPETSLASVDMDRYLQAVGVSYMAEDLTYYSISVTPCSRSLNKRI